MKKPLKTFAVIVTAVLCSVTVFGCGKGGEDIDENDTVSVTSSQTSATEKTNSENDNQETTEKSAEWATLSLDFSTGNIQSNSESNSQSESRYESDTVSDYSSTEDSWMEDIPRQHYYKSVGELFADLDIMDDEEHDEGDIVWKTYLQGNTLVYEFTFKETMDEEYLPDIKQSLDESIDNGDLDEDLHLLISIVDYAVDTDSLTIRIIFRNGDGKLITQKDIIKQLN